MAITTIGSTSNGTFEELMEDIRKLNDTHGVISITVKFNKPAKPLLTLITKREDHPYYDETKGDKT